MKGSGSGVVSGSSRTWKVMRDEREGYGKGCPPADLTANGDGAAVCVDDRADQAEPATKVGVLRRRVAAAVLMGVAGRQRPARDFAADLAQRLGEGVGN